MPIYNKIRYLSQTIVGLQKMKNELLDEAIQLGASWQELAFLDKFAAIKLYMQTHKVTLIEAHKEVSLFISKNS